MTAPRYVQQDGISVTKTTNDVGSGTHLVELSVTTAGDGPVRVAVSDPVPESHALAEPDGGTESDSDGAAYTDGRLTVEHVVRPGEDTRLGYLLDGPDEELPDPTVERVERVERIASDADLLPATVRWVGTDGETRTLDVTDANAAGVDDAVPLVRRAAELDQLQNAAVGVVLTPGNEDAAYRTVLRATRRGHSVFVTYSGVDVADEALDTLASLGATVVDPPAGRQPQAALHRLLSQEAREYGHAGIVLQTRDCPRIDYERTAAAFERADYEVVAIPEEWGESTDAPTVMVAIPAYNAARSIGDVVERTLAFADEVVVIDDGSRDETAAAAREAGATVVVHDHNRGYGGALKTAFREAASRDAKHLVVIDADGQHDPADIPLLVEAQRQDAADIVIGSRYAEGSKTKIPFVRSLGLAVINNLTNVSLGNLRPSGWVRDTQSGYRAYSRRAVRSLAADPSIGNNMGASTDILYHAHRNRLSVGEVGTTITYDVEESSTQGSLSHGLDLVRNIVWTVEYGRPLLIVGIPGAVTTLLGVSLTLFFVAYYVETGALLAVQLGIAVLFAIGGLLLCTTALTMHVLNGHPTLKRLEQ